MTINSYRASRMHWLFAIPLLFLVFSSSCKKSEKTKVNCDELSLTLEGNGAVEYGDTASFIIRASKVKEGRIFLVDSFGIETAVTDGQRFYVPNTTGPYVTNNYKLVYESSDCGMIASEIFLIRPYHPVINCSLPQGYKGLFSYGNSAIATTFKVRNNNEEISGYFNQTGQNLRLYFTKGSLVEGVFDPSDIYTPDYLPSNVVDVSHIMAIGGNDTHYINKGNVPKSQWITIKRENNAYRVKACGLTLFKRTGPGPDSLVMSFDFLTQ